MVEFLVGIIGLIAIMICIITFGEGGFHWLSAVNEAASQAWTQAVSPNSATLAQSSTPQAFIQTWNNDSGSSQRMQDLGLGYLPNSSTSVLQYNFQDVLVTGNSSPFTTTAREVLSQPLAGDPNYVDYLNYTRTYLRSQPVFSRALGQSGTSGWLIGQSTATTDRFALGKIDRGNGTVVDFGNGFQKLIYAKDTLYLRSTVFLPPLTGLQ